MALGEIQTALNGGELSPKLYARTDLAKFEAGAALLRNFIVDFRGGVVNRPGTKFIAASKSVAGAKRLIPFIVSTDAAYVLEFGNLYIRVYLNGVFVAEVVTPYLAADLALVKYTQSADVLTLVHPSYPPANFSRTTITTFTYAVISIGPGIDPPVVTTMVAPHSGPYSFGYLVTAVDLDGKEESLPSNPAVKHSEGMNETTNRVVGLSWTPPSQPVSRYNTYKWGPIDSVTMNPATVWGFIGTSQTNTFSDNNIAPDFSKQPPGWGDPFSGGQIQSIVVVNGGSGYDGVSGDWPVIPYVPLSIVGDGTGAAGYAVIDHATGKIIGAYLTNPGKNYTIAGVTANGQGGTGATFSITLSAIAPLYPGCTAYIQQRRGFAGSIPKPETLVLSETGRYNNFNTTPVSLATDAIPFSIAGEQVNTIKSMVSVSYGLLLFTTSEVHLLNGGSPYAAITPSTVSVQAQSSVGANDLQPLRVNADVLYTQNKGNRVRNLAFAWQKQAYQGSDISALAAHLFDGFMTNEWTWAEEPFKVAWLVRNDGHVVSLTYAPDQEVAAWCRHDTQGLFQSVCSVPEGDMNAVYFIVDRYIPANNSNPSDPTGNWVQYIERMAEREGCCIFDAWHLDCALSLNRPAPANTLFLSGDTGSAITLTTTTTLTGPRTPDFTGIRAYDSTAMGAPTGALVGVDWTGGRLFAYRAFTSQFMIFDINTYAVLQAPVTQSLLSQSMTYAEDGNLYGIGVLSNQAPLNKISTAGTLISSFGVASSGFVSDATHLVAASGFDTCPTTAGSLMWVQAAASGGPSNNEITVVNLTTMAWMGVDFHADEATSMGVVTKGVAGQAFVFVAGSAGSAPSAQMGLYKIGLDTIPPTMTKIAAINPNVIPGWVQVSNAYGVIFDQSDGNLIVHLQTQSAIAYNNANTYFLNGIVSSLGHDFIAILNNFSGFPPAVGGNLHWRDLGVSGPASEYRIIKFNASTGAYMWSVAVASGFPGIGRMNDAVISRGLYIFQEAAAPHKIHQINTFTGVDTTSTAGANVTPSYQMFNDNLGILIIGSSFFGPAPPAIISGPTTWGGFWATYGPAPPAPPVGAFTSPGQVIQIGCGKILITAVTNTFTATGTVIDPLDIEIPNDPNGTPIFIAPGSWTLTTPVSNISGLSHLNGKQVWALADGVVQGPFTIVGGALSAPLASPATNIVVGLKYTQQIQTLYLTMDDLQPGSIQGKRKLIPSVVLRLDCSKGLQVGQDFNSLTPVPDCNDIDANFVGLSPGQLFSGDAFVDIAASWDDKGEICVEQDLPLPASVLGIIVQVVPGDTGR